MNGARDGQSVGYSRIAQTRATIRERRDAIMRTVNASY